MKQNFNTIPEILDYMAGLYEGKKKYLIQRKVNGKFEGIYYEELKENVNLFANGLAALSIKKNDKVAIIAENRPEWVYADFAILGIGAVDVPLYPSLTVDSIEFILNNSESKAVIVSNKLQLNKILKIRERLSHLQYIICMNEKDIIQSENIIYSFTDIQEMGQVFKTHHKQHFEKCSRNVKENDLATIIYTSGTTGEPKGVMLTHKNIVSNVKDAYAHLPITSEDVFLSYLPLSHIFERTTGYYIAFASGGMIYYAESIEAVAANLIEAKPTIITSVPRLFERVYAKIVKNVESQPQAKQKVFWWAIEIGKKYRAARAAKKLPLHLALEQRLAEKLVYKDLRDKLGGRLRFFVSGGAALSTEIAQFFDALGILILEGYGLTEASPVIACNKLDHYKFGTVGIPFRSLEIKFGPDDEIIVRGPNVMQGYYKNSKETSETIKDGWLHTGDIGKFDSDGFLVITDRKKHLFKGTTGKYIAPTPIENLFLTEKFIENFVLIGDKRMYLSALIVPNFETLEKYARDNNITYATKEELLEKSEIVKIYENIIAAQHKRLANFEKIRRFKLLPDPFTIEGGELTPSLKVKRKVIEEKYKSYIDDMYR